MDTSRMKKHVGYLNNTGVRVIVVFRKIPGDETNCLVVETERLPDMYHDSVLNFVNSPEAAKSNEFYEILNRRTFPDGTNALQTLHYKNLLRKIPISNVTLLPFPGQKLPLELLNAQLDDKLDEYNKKITETVESDTANTSTDIVDESDPESVAKGMIVQAELLEAEAAKKREEAYALAPSLKPKDRSQGTTKKKRGRPPLSAEEKAARAEQRKIKRRERDRKKAAEKKQAEKKAKLEAAVKDRIGDA